MDSDDENYYTHEDDTNDDSLKETNQIGQVQKQQSEKSSIQSKTPKKSSEKKNPLQSSGFVKNKTLTQQEQSKRHAKQPKPQEIDSDFELDTEFQTKSKKRLRNTRQNKQDSKQHSQREEMIDESSQSDNFLERKEKESAQREKEGNQRKRDKKQQAKKKGKITQKYSNQELIEIRKEHFRFKIILHTNKKIGSSNLALKDRIYTKTVIRELEEEKQAQNKDKVTSPNREEQQQYFKQRADTLISQFCVKKQPTVLNQEQQKQTVQTKLNLTGKPINEEKKGKSKKKEVKKARRGR
eukprot:403339628